jgi:predicted RNA binding protein YcfA (HicA-like mRNA interferase family)
MKYNEFYRLLKENGWSLQREGKKHSIYKKEGKCIVVPRHQSKEIPKGTQIALLKQIGIKL